MKKSLSFLAIIALFFSSAIVFASQPQLITAEEVKKIIDLKQKAVIVDARTSAEYQNERIPTSINIPVENFEKEYKQLLPDKKVAVIFYCNGVKCGKSAEAAKKAIAAGYLNVKVFSGGIPEWKEKGFPLQGKQEIKKAEIKKITALELKKRMDSKEDFFLVDVREKEEFAKGHVEKAVNIPLTVFNVNINNIPKNKNIVLYCNSAKKSNKAAYILIRNGYSNIVEMEGFKYWIEKNLPFKKGE